MAFADRRQVCLSLAENIHDLRCDLNVEGFDEKLSFDIKRAPIVKNFSVQAMQLVYNEASGTGGLFHGHDSFAAGGQVSARLEFGRWTATPSFSILNWRYSDRS